MRIDNTMLQKIPLFEGIQQDEFPSLFDCVGARIEKFKKNEFISISGDTLKGIGIVLSGQVHMIKEDSFGNRAILNDLCTGSVFGESFVCGGTFTLTVSIQAKEDSSILFLPFDRIMHICPCACNFHNTLLKNMVIMIAQKNIQLLKKLEISTKRTLREKILTYVSHLVQGQKSTWVLSPLGRVHLADFLGVDRSSLTRELNNMQKEGLIEFNKNKYKM